MQYARMFLAFVLAVAWLGLAAPPWAAYDSAAQAVEPGRAPTSLTPPEWQGIQVQLAKLTAADGVSGDGFGVSVSMDGDTAVVGAIWVDVGGNIDQGAAYVFYRNQGGPNAWGQVAKLTAADGATQDYFGQSVSISGDTAVVGALNANVGGNLMQGAAYVFSRDHGGANAWGQVAKLTAADGAAYDRFGISVAVSSDTALVGAYWANVSGHIEQGAAYVYYRNQGGADAWGQVAKLTAAGGAGGIASGSLCRSAVTEPSAERAVEPAQPMCSIATRAGRTPGARSPS
jgi:hypothetical protein